MYDQLYFKLKKENPNLNHWDLVLLVYSEWYELDSKDEPTSKLRPVKFPKTTKKKTKKVVVINEPDSLKTISIKEIK
jgi:hypothetical protein